MVLLSLPPLVGGSEREAYGMTGLAVDGFCYPEPTLWLLWFLKPTPAVSA